MWVLMVQDERNGEKEREMKKQINKVEKNVIELIISKFN